MAYQYKYNPNRSSEWNYGGKKWRLSRSKIDFFFECPRCFYLDNKLGTKRPGMPSFNLNIAVDELFKKEFDVHRAAKTKHPIMEEYGIDAVPFQHKDIDTWRENFEGLEYRHEPTGLTVSGAIDDVWVTPQDELIVVDYKSTSKAERIETLGDSAWAEQYARQIGVYQWLLENMGFKVHDTGYFVYANASQTEPGFNNTLTFETTLIPTEGDRSWVEPKLEEIKACLEAETYPETGERCEFCPYREASGKKLQAIHMAKKAQGKIVATEPSTPNDTINAIKKKYSQ